MSEKKKKLGGGVIALSVSCRGKLARSRDLVIGPVIRHKRVAAALPENIAANHNITQKNGKIKAERTRMATNCLKLGRDAMSHVPRLM